MSVVEIKDDLFSDLKSECFVHCVSSDFKMGAGIAKKFSEMFGDILTLEKLTNKKIKNNVKIGNIFTLSRDYFEKDIKEKYLNLKYVIYLVTKEKYYHKPTLESLVESLTFLKKFCDENKIKNISMPKIGCGLDQLSWKDVKNSINKILTQAPLKKLENVMRIIKVYYI